MKLSDFFSKALDTAIANDPRGYDAVAKTLQAKKKDYEKLSDKEKANFDLHELENPYIDSRILYGDPSKEVKKAIVGIDLDVSELVLADRLNEKGAGIDLAVTHHPAGSALATLHNMLDIQPEILRLTGVPINIAEDLLESRAKEVQRRFMPYNHNKTVDAARLLDIALVCMHTMADNMVATYLDKLFKNSPPERLQDIIDMLLEIPEYKDAQKDRSGPTILVGTPKRTAGKIYVDMTGGTTPPKEIFSSLATSGINTVVTMHLSDEHKKEAEKHKVNVVIAGHISSDNLGMNLLLDAIIAGEQFEIVACGGFRRYSRL